MAYRLLSYKSGKEGRAGILVGDQVYDAAKLTGVAAWSTTVGALADWSKANRAFAEVAKKIESGKSRAKGVALKKVTLLAPLLYPGTIYCAGANYTDHMAEMARAHGDKPGKTMKQLGEKPWHFIKASRSPVVGPGAEVTLPAFAKNVDWEIELAAVIGKPARNVPVDKALSYVAGYTIANDLSARDAGRRTKNPPHSPFFWDWTSHKSWEGSCPLGPWIVPASQIRNPHDLDMKLWVGDELMQDSNSGKMIFDTAEQIAMLSSRVTLHPGDLVLTGTPAGVGTPRNRFLKRGETVKMWIEKIGEISNKMV